MHVATHRPNRNAGHRRYFGSAQYHDLKLPALSKQAKQVYDLMVRDGRVTRLTALHYGIANLTARIAEIRTKRIAVECEIKVDAAGKDYGSWSLAKA